MLEIGQFIINLLKHALIVVVFGILFTPVRLIMMFSRMTMNHCQNSVKSQILISLVTQFLKLVALTNMLKIYPLLRTSLRIRGSNKCGSSKILTE